MFVMFGVLLIIVMAIFGIVSLLAWVWHVIGKAIAGVDEEE